jgi:methanogenic corrinoid protein MtbC1
MMRVRVEARGVSRMPMSSSSPSGPVEDVGMSSNHPAEPFLRAILAGDQARALAIAVGAQRSGMEHLYQDVVAAALEQVGSLWQQGRISVADEHLATAVCEATLASLYPGLAWPVFGPPAVVACVAPERHQLGARMAADLLALDGWRVAYLGADVPVPALVEMAVRRKPLLVGLSAALEHNVPALAEAIAALRRAAPDVRVLAGGRAIRELADPAALGADAWVLACRETVGAAAPWKR